MTTFHTVDIEGLIVFWREAGDPGSPKLLLLGGFPASSQLTLRPVHPAERCVGGRRSG
jgi:pimeloyl-ACP methyl ester carboxylesterase